MQEKKKEKKKKGWVIDIPPTGYRTPTHPSKIVMATCLGPTRLRTALHCTRTAPGDWLAGKIFLPHCYYDTSSVLTYLPHCKDGTGQLLRIHLPPSTTQRVSGWQAGAGRR